MRVLLVEDDPGVRDAVTRALRGAGYDLRSVDDGPQALESIRDGGVDLVVLDLGLPTMDGLEVMRRIRGDGKRTPVLALTARASIADRVAGLDAGADDYLAKSFALDELLARVRALMRRSSIREAEQGATLEAGDIRVDPRTMEVHRGERKIDLTRTEYQLLELFVRNPRAVLTRSAIFEHVWGYDFGPESNSLDVYIGYLRRKLEAGGEARVIHTVRGVGYALRPA